MRLIDIMKDITFEYRETTDINNININTISYNSKHSKQDDMFVCIKGETVDGHKYAKKAYEKGSRVFIAQETLQLPQDAHVLYVEDSRIALSKASANLFKHPTSEIMIIGVTGTKGKTTITNYISTVLNSAGINTATIGTNGMFYNGKYQDTLNTTPESYELHKNIRQMVDEGIKCVCMEVSSGGIMMNRVNDIDFDIAVFTNLAEDHIGPKEHPTFEHYLNCKAKLFKMAKYGIINLDDEYSDEIIKQATCEITTFSIDKPSEHRATNINYSNSINELGTDYTCNTKGQELKVHIAPPGVFNVYNSLAVIAVCEYMNINRETTLKALQNVQVKGRVEVLPVLSDATVIIDYAHNGVSLESILQTVKQYDHNRLICLFGSVGGRTKGRRKELGDVASRECDLCILTSDNPDFEEPMEIIKDIEVSFKNSKCDYIIEPDRKIAIEKTIKLAQKGDVIVLAGKGHEEYQLIKGEKIPFKESQIVLNSVKTKKL